MNTIDAYEQDIHMQPDFVGSFEPSGVSFKPSVQEHMIFSGSGDSLASAMLAESYSYGRVRAADPLDLYTIPPLTRSRRICPVSVSGNTLAGIRAVRTAGSVGAVITSNIHSRLARAAVDADPSCRLVRLCHPSSKMFTAGSISFLDSALTCISLVVPSFTIPDSYPILFAKAEDDAIQFLKVANAAISEGGRIFVLGNMFTYPLAMYCAAKFYEVLGYDVRYCRLEQFSHMELFSAKRGDCVVIFGRKNQYNHLLAEGLRLVGIEVVCPDCLAPVELSLDDDYDAFDDNTMSDDIGDKDNAGTTNDWHARQVQWCSSMLQQTLYYTFFSQFVTLHAARQKGVCNCHFVTAEKIRTVSNTMIY